LWVINKQIHHKMRVFLIISFFLILNNLTAQDEGIFLFESSQGYSYINNEGEQLIDNYFYRAGRFFEGKAAASTNGYVGYIDMTGELTIPSIYEYALPFYNGIAKVWKDGKPYLINKDGQIIFEHNYRYIDYAIYDSFEPIFIVTTQNYKSGVINANGSLIIDTIFYNLSQFSEGLSIIDNGRGGVINLQGEQIVPMNLYNSISRYSCGRALVKSDKWDHFYIGFINQEGNLVYKMRYSHSISDLYKDDRFIAIVDDTTGTSSNKISVVLDLDGNIVYSSLFRIFDFHNSIAMIYGIQTKEYEYGDGRKYTTRKVDVINKFGDILAEDISARSTFLRNDTLFYIYRNHVEDSYGNKIEITNYKVPYNNDFFHKNLYFSAYERGYSTEWVLFLNSNTKLTFSFIDRDEGFKDGLLYIILENGQWGYLNENADLVFLSPKKDYSVKHRKLNIDYSITQSNVFNNSEVEEMPNTNPAKPMHDDFKSFTEPKVILDNSNTYLKSLGREFFEAYKLYIINPSHDTLRFSDGREQIFVQAKDKSGNWRTIETDGSLFRHGFNTHKLKPNEYWETFVFAYDGGFKTKMRVLVKFPTINNFNFVGNKIETIKISEGFEITSNTIDCKINPVQFIRKQSTKSKINKYLFEDYNFDRIMYFD
ncbi:WG repeat-containing protein, partial [Alkalitalea saponilacus]|uniref:WG repeat-containing protein n=1 Tax=Alkalitalea saponilacus TaxID=889453 RepID=UPI001F29EEFF